MISQPLGFRSIWNCCERSIDRNDSSYAYTLCGISLLLLFHPKIPFPLDENLLTSRYSIIVFHGGYSSEVHPLVLPVDTFASRTRHATYSELTSIHSLYIPFVRRQFFSITVSFWKRLEDAFPITTILSSSSRRLSLISLYLIYILIIYISCSLLVGPYNNLILISIKHKSLFGLVFCE